MIYKVMNIISSLYKVESRSNPVHGKVYPIQHYIKVIKFCQ